MGSQERSETAHLSLRNHQANPVANIRCPAREVELMDDQLDEIIREQVREDLREVFVQEVRRLREEAKNEEKGET